MKVAVVGLGYWGPNLMRNFSASDRVTRVFGCDKEEKRIDALKNKFTNVTFNANYDELLSSEDLDVVCLSTPVDTHYELSRKALEVGKHVWVEKPFTSESWQAEELIALAEKKNLVLFVDHTFLYHAPVMKVKEIINSGEIGDIIYYDSVRINLGLFQQDVNVVWDLAPHDFSIMNYLLEKEVKSISANGIANVNQMENIAHIAAYFEDSCFAHFHLNWTSPVKIRRIIIGGTKKMIVYDDLESSEKVKVYDTGVELSNKSDIDKALVQYRIGDMYSPCVGQQEALANATVEFLQAIEEKRNPRTSGIDGLYVVKMIEAANESLKNKGAIKGV